MSDPDYAKLLYEIGETDWWKKHPAYKVTMACGLPDRSLYFIIKSYAEDWLFEHFDMLMYRNEDGTSYMVGQRKYFCAADRIYESVAHRSIASAIAHASESFRIKPQEAHQ